MLTSRSFGFHLRRSDNAPDSNDTELQPGENPEDAERRLLSSRAGKSAAEELIPALIHRPPTLATTTRNPRIQLLPFRYYQPLDRAPDRVDLVLALGEARASLA